MRLRRTGLGAVLVGITGTAGLTVLVADEAPGPKPGEVAVTLVGGYHTDRVDRGRPVVLIARALGVKPEVFRDAFSHVRPVGPDRGPTGDEARANKHELLSRLQKYGVTNERLDEVSDFYRYPSGKGGLWKHKPAIVFATVADGKVTGYRVAEPGYGYSTPPTVRVDGLPGAGGVVTLRFDKELTKNGGIEKLAVAPATTEPAPDVDPDTDDPPGPPPPRPPR